ncbi:MAG: NAD-dependent deacetylase [Parvibaculaceae bacterium]
MTPTETLREMVMSARNIVGFTGAGISTECGIPDFRSPGGLWTRYKPIDFQTFLSSPEARREGLSRYLKIREAVGDVKPGRGHRALAQLAWEGRLSQVITQNIDGLHQASGLGADQVIELHGNGTYAHCLSCARRHELDWVAAALERQPGAPACVACGGIVKTATISFGQAMPADAMQRAEEATLSCDLFLAIGSSLVVYPAAGFPLLAKRAGARLVILNREATDLDGHADLVLHEDIGAVLETFLPK